MHLFKNSSGTPLWIVLFFVTTVVGLTILSVEAAAAPKQSLNDEIPLCHPVNGEDDHFVDHRMDENSDDSKPGRTHSHLHSHLHTRPHTHSNHRNRMSRAADRVPSLAGSGSKQQSNFVKMWIKERNENKKLIKTIRKKTPLIIDSDLGMFPDDPIAFAIAHRMADQDQIHILATVGSTRYEGVAMAISTLNTFLGRPNIPVGVTRSRDAYTDQQGSQNWTEFIRTNFPHKISKNSEADDAVMVYRKALEGAADHSVTILQIGHFTNLATLLESQPDKISKLDGSQLVKRKVREVVTMAGNFRQSKNWNIKKDIGRAQFFSKHWPTRVTFVGSEVSDLTRCDSVDQYAEPSSTNPISAALYFAHRQFGICTGYHDAVTTLMVLDKETSKLFCAMPGTIEILPDGTNKWLYRNNGHNSSSHNSSSNHGGGRNRSSHRYLKFKSSTELSHKLITERINYFLPANKFKF